MLRSLIAAAALAAILAPSGLAQTFGFCFGDGTQTPGCPCTNLGATGHGCANSANVSGAELTAAGTTSPDTMVFTVSGEPATALSIVYQSDLRRGGASFGDGLQCLTGTLRKLYVKHAAAGTFTAPAAGDPSITTRSAAVGDTIPPGGFRYYHVQYRDPAPAYCSAPAGGSWNVTNSFMIHW